MSIFQCQLPAYFFSCHQGNCEIKTKCSVCFRSDICMSALDKSSKERSRKDRYKTAEINGLFFFFSSPIESHELWIRSQGNVRALPAPLRRCCPNAGVLLGKPQQQGSAAAGRCMLHRGNPLVHKLNFPAGPSTVRFLFLCVEAKWVLTYQALLLVMTSSSSRSPVLGSVVHWQAISRRLVPPENSFYLLLTAQQAANVRI